MDPTKLLDQFLGGDTKARLQQAGGTAKQKFDSFGGVGGFAGGAAAGGLLGLLLGNKKVRKMAGGVAGYGGAAALGALAFKAYQNWQQGKQAETAPAATQADIAQTETRFLPDATPAGDGQPFQLSLIRAMIGAAKADGHVDAAEQKLLFEQVEQMGLDAEAKGFVFDALGKPVDLAEIAGAAQTQEQAAELYLVSRLAIDPDHPAEKAYLEALAHRLNLPADLVAHLNRQAEAGLPA
ncbi:MAG: tellurite resistance TerB family protein [Alphaproteobacteria bacterium]|nr:tellurite resistance TerB family protein [Alphaproteobacteria bacterium]MBU0796142.1 tellurite resistance TerB family protein [Alphaproteobacteria bacterium]MBU0888513.1 tellurite resistance TerB family protein [Alphaproteobacteria bacterium]MBU1813024.1 tellurite resistance TerB family protein [Alphaproteobacteria bacterium]